MKDKFELIEEAYGRAAVEADFEKWCREVQDKNPRYPLTEYVKVVDSRLGPEFAEKRADVDDPRVSQITATAYEMTGVLPSARSIAKLLLAAPPEEIIAALKEYVTTLDENEYKTGMRAFFTENGGIAVIIARKGRTDNAR
jgi:hypothetical protein